MAFRFGFDPFQQKFSGTRQTAANGENFGINQVTDIGNGPAQISGQPINCR